MIKNSLINADWTLEILDSADTVLNTYTCRTQWLDNFTTAISNGASEPLGRRGFDAIKFGSGTTPTVAGMTGIENIVAYNRADWPKADNSTDVVINTVYNSSTGFYTKTSTESKTLLVGLTDDFLPGTVITEIGGAYYYNYDNDEYTDGTVMNTSYLDSEFMSDLYAYPGIKYNPLCATRGLITDGTNPVSITLLDGQKVRYTVVTSLEFKLSTMLEANTVVYDPSDVAIPTTVTFEYIPHTAPNSYIAQAPLGYMCSTNGFNTCKSISSIDETNSAGIPFAYNYVTDKFMIEPVFTGLYAGGMTDIKYLDFTDDNSIANDELTLARVTFTPPIPVASAGASAFTLGLNYERFIEPKYITTPGNLPAPVFNADPDLEILPNWTNIAKSTFAGKEMQITTSVTSKTITVRHNSNVYTYPYVAGTNANTSDIDFKISSNLKYVGMSPSSYTVGYYAPIFDDTTYYFSGESTVNTEIKLELKNHDDASNFAEYTLTLDVARPVFNPLSTGPFLGVVANGNGPASVYCTDLSNYSLAPGPELIGDNGTAIAYSPDGALVAIGQNTAPYLSVYNANTWALIPDTIPVLSSTVNSIDFSSNGNMLAVGMSSGGYMVIDTTTWTVVTTPAVGGAAIAVKFSHNNNYLAVGHTAGNRLSVFDTSTWLAVPGIPSTPGITVSFDWSSDDSKLALAHYLSPFFRILDTTTWAFDSGTPDVGGIEAIAYNVDNSQLAVANGIQLKIFDTATWATLHDIRIPGDGRRMQLSPDGLTMAVLHDGGSVLSLFDTTTWLAKPDSTWFDAFSAKGISFRP